jgi:hypothetical protein
MYCCSSEKGSRKPTFTADGCREKLRSKSVLYLETQSSFFLTEYIHFNEGRKLHCDHISQPSLLYTNNNTKPILLFLFDSFNLENSIKFIEGTKTKCVSEAE